jgi:hypothetical protein
MIMSNKQNYGVRELSAIEFDQVSGGCQCGADGGCVGQGDDGVFYNCGGTPMFGGMPFPLGTSMAKILN